MSKGVAPLGIDIGDAITERARSQALVDIVQLPFVAKERVSVTDQALQIADLRAIYGWIINLVEDALGSSKPNLAQSGVCSPHAVLIAACPAGGDPGTATGRIPL